MYWHAVKNSISSPSHNRQRVAWLAAASLPACVKLYPNVSSPASCRRHFTAWIGSVPATTSNFKRILKKGSVAVIVGGIAEVRGAVARPVAWIRCCSNMLPAYAC